MRFRVLVVDGTTEGATRTASTLHQEEWRTADVLSAGVVRSMAGRVARIWDRYQMKIVDVVNENCRVLVEHSIAYLDSG